VWVASLHQGLSFLKKSPVFGRRHFAWAAKAELSARLRCVRRTSLPIKMFQVPSDGSELRALQERNRDPVIVWNDAVTSVWVNRD
jgi:hypothetical protein